MWKIENINGVKGISKKNSDLILSFLSDMEVGKNLSHTARKGERSSCRLLDLKSRLIFFVQQFNDNPLSSITQDEIHQLFFNMRQGLITKSDGQNYIGISNYVRDFKVFWRWLFRTGKAATDITIDIRKSDGRKPAWVYLTEEQFKILANQAASDYRALIWLMYDTGMRVTEAYSIRVNDFSNDFTQLNIRKEYAKTFGRIIKLKLCSSFIRELVKFHKLGPNDFIFMKEPPAFNKYLRTLASKIFGKEESLARKPYNKMRLYDIRHNASCYWLKRYSTTTGLMYRMGWSEEKEVRYYSEFLGQADSIDDENMVTAEEKTKYEKRIELLENDRQKTNELVNELIKKIADMQISLKNKVQENKKQNNSMESVLVHSADRPYRSNL
ncbi:MAG TPA: site-specific integrase [Anaerohalosphaeraceae bacterium]|nr:site-specific integrase [Anaerohalosphaeraceae bacterium]